MTVGDRGVIFSIDLGGYNATGNTAVFLAAPGEEPDAIGAGLRLTPMTILDDGLTAVYQSTGLDFQESGPWVVAVEVTTADGRVFTSALGKIYVNPLLAN